MFDIISCPVAHGDDGIHSAPAWFLDMMFRILKDIENSSLNNATFVFKGGFLSIFAYMLESEQILTSLSEDTSMGLENKIEEIKLKLESA